MAYTPHGHHIPGSAEFPHTIPVKPCGGPKFCSLCGVHAGSFESHPSNKKSEK